MNLTRKGLFIYMNLNLIISVQAYKRKIKNIYMDYSFHGFIMFNTLSIILLIISPNTWAIPKLPYITSLTEKKHHKKFWYRFTLNWAKLKIHKKYKDLPIASSASLGRPMSSTLKHHCNSSSKCLVKVTPTSWSSQPKFYKKSWSILSYYSKGTNYRPPNSWNTENCLYFQ